MENQIIEDALQSSLTLLHKEIESIIIDDLKEEYLCVIEKIETALKELNGNG